MIAEPWNKGRRYRVRELRQGGHEVGEEIGNEDDVDLSASLAALVVRELDALSRAARDEPASVVVRFVLPRGWHSDD